MWYPSPRLRALGDYMFTERRILSPSAESLKSSQAHQIPKRSLAGFLMHILSRGKYSLEENSFWARCKLIEWLKSLRGSQLDPSLGRPVSLAASFLFFFQVQASSMQ